MHCFEHAAAKMSALSAGFETFVHCTTWVAISPTSGRGTWWAVLQFSQGRSPFCPNWTMSAGSAIRTICTDWQKYNQPVCGKKRSRYLQDLNLRVQSTLDFKSLQFSI